MNTKKINPAYLKGTKKSNQQMKKEIEKCSGPDKPESCYDEWSADKTYKRNKMKNELNIENENDAENLKIIKEIFNKWETQILNSFKYYNFSGDVILESLSAKVKKSLKKKAESANMPLGALTGVYRKGLAAWLTGHRQGIGQHQWAMARVNSFIRGGKVRSIDKAEWKKVQKHRNK
jgi:hypothetical protein